MNVSPGIKAMVGGGRGGGGAYNKIHLLQGKSAELSHHFHVFLQIFAFNKSGCLLLPVEGERFQGKLQKIFER